MNNKIIYCNKDGKFIFIECIELNFVVDFWIVRVLLIIYFEFC